MTDTRLLVYRGNSPTSELKSARLSNYKRSEYPEDSSCAEFLLCGGFALYPEDSSCAEFVGWASTGYFRFSLQRQPGRHAAEKGGTGLHTRGTGMQGKAFIPECWLGTTARHDPMCQNICACKADMSHELSSTLASPHRMVCKRSNSAPALMRQHATKAVDERFEPKAFLAWHDRFDGIGSLQVMMEQDSAPSPQSNQFLSSHLEGTIQLDASRGCLEAAARSSISSIIGPWIDAEDESDEELVCPTPPRLRRGDHEALS